MHRDAAFVFEYVLEQSQSLEASKRARLVRGLARLCGDEKWAKEFSQMAKEIEHVEENFFARKHRFSKEISE